VNPNIVQILQQDKPDHHQVNEVLPSHPFDDKLLEKQKIWRKNED
jgi:hypothetical protein